MSARVITKKPPSHQERACFIFTHSATPSRFILWLSLPMQPHRTILSSNMKCLEFSQIALGREKRVKHIYVVSGWRAWRYIWQHRAEHICRGERGKSNKFNCILSPLDWINFISLQPTLFGAGEMCVHLISEADVSFLIRICFNIFFPHAAGKNFSYPHLSLFNETCDVCVHVNYFI